MSCRTEESSFFRRSVFSEAKDSFSSSTVLANPFPAEKSVGLFSAE